MGQAGAPAVPIPPTPILVCEELDSTNAEARRRAEAGEAGPLWITARRQTAGRGRRDRAWETGEGNLAATLLTTTAKRPAEAAQLAFVSALAVHDLACAYVGEAAVALKWPNDVLVAGRKASGVLIESGSRADGRLWLAIGIGVNLVSAPTSIERPATSLAAHRRDGAPPIEPDAALARLAEALAQRMAAWEQDGFAPVRRAWTARAHGLGRPCAVRLERERFEGLAEGLEADGALRLRMADGTARRVAAGDVVFEDAL